MLACGTRFWLVVTNASLEMIMTLKRLLLL